MNTDLKPTFYFFAPGAYPSWQLLGELHFAEKT